MAIVIGEGIQMAYNNIRFECSNFPLRVRVRGILFNVLIIYE